MNVAWKVIHNILLLYGLAFLILNVLAQDKQHGMELIGNDRGNRATSCEVPSLPIILFVEVSFYFSTKYCVLPSLITNLLYRYD